MKQFPENFWTGNFHLGNLFRIKSNRRYRKIQFPRGASKLRLRRYQGSILLESHHPLYLFPTCRNKHEWHGILSHTKLWEEESEALIIGTRKSLKKTESRKAFVFVVICCQRNGLDFRLLPVWTISRVFKNMSQRQNQSRADAESFEICLRGTAPGKIKLQNIFRRTHLHTLIALIDWLCARAIDVGEKFWHRLPILNFPSLPPPLLRATDLIFNF